MIEFIDKDYETVKQKTMYAAWAALKLACDRQQIAAPSYKTFTVLVHQRAGAEQTLKRRGSRAAYQQQPFYWALEQRTPRYGDRPFEIGHIDHPALGQSPRAAFDMTTAQTGDRSPRSIRYDQDFLILTLPTTRKGTAKITAGRGMKINHLYYWSEHFRDPAWETKQVPVRYDPFDAGTPTRS